MAVMVVYAGRLRHRAQPNDMLRQSSLHFLLLLFAAHRRTHNLRMRLRICLPILFQRGQIAVMRRLRPHDFPLLDPRPFQTAVAAVQQ